MPFHGHQRVGDRIEGPSALGGMVQAAQTLEVVGAPAAAGPTSSSTADALLLPADSSAALSARRNAGQAMSNPPPFDSPRRAFGRQPEELHIPVSSSAPRQQPHHQFAAPPDAPSGSNPSSSSITAPQSNPQHAQYAPSSSSNTLPGALQPGNTSRAPPSSTGAASSALPTLPQLSTQSSQQPSTSRTVPINSHGNSRSSPPGYDQSKYKQYGNTAENSKYVSPPSTGYQPNTPQGAKYSPLGLADIRPHADLADLTMSPGSRNGEPQVPTNSNYLAPWPIYAVDWSKWPMATNGPFAGKIAIGSYLEDNHNYIQIIDAHRTQPDPDTPDAIAGEVKLEYVKTAEASHSYPVTRILWEPPSSQKQSTDLLATSGDHLRLWSLPNSQQSQQTSNSITRPSNQRDPPVAKLSPLALLSNSKSPEHTAPITSLDWNTVSPSLIITSSIDTTCTIWDIPTLTAKTQLIAHDKEVYDVRFCANSVDVFVTCGSDGSVRMFDLRSLEHSTIIYEPNEKTDKSLLLNAGNSSPSTPHAPPIWPPPLLRIAASPHDTHLLATFAQDSNVVRILDVRQPGQALLDLKGHSGAINCVDWSPTRRGTLASGADDCLVLVWDLINQHNAATIAPSMHSSGTSSSSSSTTQERGPAAAWQCDYEVNNLSWSPSGGTGSSGHPREWLGVCGGKGFWAVSL